MTLAWQLMIQEICKKENWVDMSPIQKFIDMIH
jgi:hypothetical protein